MKRITFTTVLCLLAALLMLGLTSCKTQQENQTALSSVSDVIEDGENGDDDGDNKNVENDGDAENDEAIKKEGLWENAVYLSDTELGSGDRAFLVEVQAENASVRFTIHTDESTVGAALLKLGLIDGEQGEYGLYIKVVNGMTADYDIDQTYWAFYIDGEYASSGIDATNISEGVVYQLVRTK